MQFSRPNAELWIPDDTPDDVALARTTHMAIGAHQDDLEIMALEGIIAGYGVRDKWFLGVVMTDGASSARAGLPGSNLYANYTDEDMKAVRSVEQKKAAFIGEYTAQALLDHPSSAVKDPSNRGPIEDVKKLLEAARPETVYLHNLADKHATHIAVSLRCLTALRELPKDARPRRVVGCEVWRDLDWLVDSDKVVFRLDNHENLAWALIGVFDSQIEGGKRYDVATIGRRRAHATYHESRVVDTNQMLNFGMDLTPLIEDDSLDIADYVLGHVDRFRADVAGKLAEFAPR
jgi:LmbE family N-acetylglucosaminyl deacetylase